MATVIQPSAGQPTPTADWQGCDPDAFAQQMGVTAEWQQIKAITAELFPGPMALEVVRDPELPGDVYIWIQVVSPADVEETVMRELDWINRSGDAAHQQAGYFRISVDVVR